MIEQFKFILFESFQSLRRYPLYSFISSLTIMICLIVISFIIYVSNITSNISENFRGNESVLKIFINNKISNENSNQICNDIKNDFNFDKVIFENKIKLFNNIDQDLKIWIKDDINFVPCLCSVNIDIKQIEQLNNIVKKINQDYSDKIDKIVYPHSYLAKFEKMASIIYSITLMIGLVFFIVSIFNISNIIKLSIESRKDVIEILKLHGSGKYFIKAPFIIEGLIHACIGFLFSTLIILFIFNTVSLENYNHFIVKSLITTIPFKIYIILNLIFGVFLGFIGANLGVSNYLE